MATDSATGHNWSSRLAIRYLGVYLIYLSTMIRLVSLYDAKPEQGPVVLLLAIYGALLVCEPLLTRR